MTKHHKRILEQGGLLDDLVIYAALILLRVPTMSGFQPTVLCQVKGFKPMNTDGCCNYIIMAALPCAMSKVMAVSSFMTVLWVIQKRFHSV